MADRYIPFTPKEVATDLSRIEFEGSKKSQTTELPIQTQTVLLRSKRHNTEFCLQSHWAQFRTWITVARICWPTWSWSCSAKTADLGLGTSIQLSQCSWEHHASAPC